MEKRSLEALLKDSYKIEIEDNDFLRLQSVLNTYGLNERNCTITLYNDLASFMNALHLAKTIEMTRMQCKVELDDIIYEMTPTLHGETRKIEIHYPKWVNRTNDIVAEDYNKLMHQNVVILRTIRLGVRTAAEYDEKYTMIILNTALDIRRGVMFEKID